MLLNEPAAAPNKLNFNQFKSLKIQCWSNKK